MQGLNLRGWAEYARAAALMVLVVVSCASPPDSTTAPRIESSTAHLTGDPEVTMTRLRG